MAQQWSEISGTILGQPELSKQTRMKARKMTRLREAVDPATEFNLGKKSGDRVGFKLLGDLPFGTADTPLNETQKVPFAKPPEFTGTGRIYRRAQAIAWTGTRADLDRMDVEDGNIRSLRNHFARVDNKIIYDALLAGRSFTYVAQSASTYTFLSDGTVTQQAQAGFSRFHANKMALELRRKNVPPADGNGYIFFVSPTIEDDLLNDTASNGFIDVKKYANSGAEGILRNEIGRIGPFRVVVDNDRMADQIGQNSVRGSGIVVGFEAIKEILGPYPVHLRANLNLGGDFGNQAGIAWQSMHGYVVPWNYTTHDQGSVLHYTST